jgi:hypothetical protein
MISILETKIKMGMSLYEFQALRQVLVALQTGELHEMGLSLGQIEAIVNMRKALDGFIASPGFDVSPSED